MGSSPKVIDPGKVTQALFFLNAAIWLSLGILSLARIESRNSHQAITAWIVAILMLGNAGVMLLSGVVIGKQQKRFYYLAVAVVVVNILLTVTDQFGMLDLITLVIDLVLLGLLVATRGRYLHTPDGVSQPG